MASNAVEKELVEIFEKAKKAADKASADEYRKADEQRCVDALKALHAFPITNQFLLATQLGKRLRTLTKHPRENIRTVASKLLDAWKKAAAAELSAKFNPKGPPKLPSTGKYNEPLLTKPEEEQVKSVTPEEEEMKRKLELSAESNTNHPPKFLIANDQKKAMISEEKKNKSVTIKTQDNVVQRLDGEVLSNLEQNLDAEILSNPEQNYVRPKTSSSDKSVTLKTSETNKIWSNPEQNYIRPKTSSSDKSVTPKTSGDDVVKKPKLKLSSPSNLIVPSKLPSHIGNKSAKSEDNRAKSAKVIISAEKEEKKPNRELSAESNPKGTPKLPCTVKRNQPLCTNSKEKQASTVKTNEPLRTNSEEKPTKSVPINKVSADKEGKKRKLELSPEFNTNRPPKIPTMAKPNDQKKTTMSEEKKDKSVKVKASGDNELKKPQQLELSSQSNLNVPPKLPSTAKCNDQWRDKVRENLLEAFSKVVHEVQDEELERVRGFDPVRVAVEVETVMFNKLGRSDSTLQLKAKYRSISFNLKDGKNPDLRRRVFTGEIKAEKLIVMTAEEMASDARKFENDMIKNKALFHCERGMKKAATTNEFRCGRCGKNETTYYQMQTRSADEPMTTYVTCTNCNNRWKFC